MPTNSTHYLLEFDLHGLQAALMEPDDLQPVIPPHFVQPFMDVYVEVIIINLNILLYNKQPTYM